MKNPILQAFSELIDAIAGASTGNLRITIKNIDIDFTFDNDDNPGDDPRDDDETQPIEPMGF